MNNKLQLIETPDYILAVSDEAGSQGAYRLEYMSHKPHCYTRIYCNKLKNSTIILWDKGIWKGEAGFTYEIIAYQPKGNVPELDLPLFPEIVVEDDVEKLACDWHKKEYGFLPQLQVIKAYIEGYKAATKVYSEEDLRKAFLEGNKYPQESKYLPDFYLGNYFEKFLQSLKQPKTPKWFVAEMEEESGFTPNGYYSKIVLKTTTINDKTYLVGHYE
jgi:hypothetical protein